MPSCRETDDVKHVEAVTGQTLNEFQARVAYIVSLICSGAHNAAFDWARVNWQYGDNGVSVPWTRGHLATYDLGALTSLVFLCHEARIRLQIEAESAKTLRLSFWQRTHQGRIWARHPELSEAIAQHREWLPADSPLIYRNHPENQEVS